jgi:hypothetical protein
MEGARLKFCRKKKEGVCFFFSFVFLCDKEVGLLNADRIDFL